MTQLHLDRQKYDFVVEGEFNLVTIDPDKLHLVWEEAEQELESLVHLWDKMHTLESMLELMKAGRLRLWVVFQGDVKKFVFLTFINMYPKGVVLQIVCGKGVELDSYAQMVIEALEDYGARYKCTHLEVVGREGFARFLRPYGFEHLYTSVWKPIKSKRLN